MILIIILLSVRTSAEDCENILCSNIVDHVCGLARTLEGKMDISTYQNICHLRKIQCRLQPIIGLIQVPDALCHIKPKLRNIGGRRITDFGIAGAHQMCNHTCPTYCVDTYEPSCAKIWQRGKKKFTYRPMINHCHIDMLSCSLGVNVTIQSIGKCYKNPSGLLFMSTVAAMKSMRLLEDIPEAKRRSMMNYPIDIQIENLLSRISRK